MINLRNPEHGKRLAQRGRSGGQCNVAGVETCKNLDGSGDYCHPTETSCHAEGMPRSANWQVYFFIRDVSHFEYSE